MFGGVPTAIVVLQIVFLSATSLAGVHLRFFPFGRDRLITCEAMISQAGPNDRLNGIHLARGPIESIRTAATPLAGTGTDSHNGNIDPYAPVRHVIKDARSAQASLARIRQLQRDLEQPGAGFGITISGRESVGQWLEAANNESDRLVEWAHQRLPKGLPMPLNDVRPSPILGMIHLLMTVPLAGALYLLPDERLLVAMVLSVSVDQMLERFMPMLRRSGVSDVAALTNFWNSQEPGILHLGIGFPTLRGVVEDWHSLPNVPAQRLETNRLAGLEDHIIGREYGHELWRLKQLSRKTGGGYSSYLDQRNEELERLTKLYISTTLQPTQLGFFRFLRDPRLGFYTLVYTYLFVVRRSPEDVSVTLAIRNTQNPPSLPPRQPLIDLKKYRELWDGLRDLTPAGAR